MITTRTAALVTAAAMSLLGTVVPAAFAQVGPQLNFNQNTDPSTQICPAVGILDSEETTRTTCETNQGQGNCQFNVGADDESDATGELTSEDCA